MTTIANLEAAINGLLASVIQIGIGVVVLGVVVVLVYAALRGAIR